MSGYDKHLAVERLKAQGWTEDAEAGTYMLRPPRELLEKLASMAFDVYDARDLQEFAPAREAGAGQLETPVRPQRKEPRQSLAALQAEYNQELKRTTGRGCTFAYCGGGWYTLRLEGSCVQERQRWQRRMIERELMKLRGRPDFVS